MMNRIFLTIAALFLCCTLFAQSAENIMKKAEEAFNKDGGVKANFTLAMQNRSKGTTESFDGTILMKGNRFFIQTPEIRIWFNGKDQWSLLQNSNEINLTTPGSAELDAMNPTVLFNLYKNGFKAALQKDKKIQNTPFYVIRLEPTAKRPDLRSITVAIHKSSYQIKEIVMDQTNQLLNTILITQYNRNQNLKETEFTFDEQQHPDIEVIDLR
ncbi:MAG: LolA-like putative outer membrane lipoprotein chaperone [Bacteroidales bacterium]